MSAGGPGDIGRGAPDFGEGEDFMPVFWGTAAADVILGSAEADQIYGLDGDDALYGGDGADLLAGGKGSDGMAGGRGNDIYEVGAAGDRVMEAANEGIDEIRAWVSYRLADNVENLTLVGPGDFDGVGNALANRIGGTGGANKLYGGVGDDLLSGAAGNDRLYGEVGADQLYGGDGADYLDGGAGGDLLLGGKGDDVYEVDATGDRVVELQGEGIDGVRAWISYWLTANVETLTLVGPGDLDGVGNALDNKIYGNAGANMLSGGAGNDVLSGGAGNDRLSGVDGADWLYGGDGNDLLEGGAGNDLMAGGNGDDRYSVGAAGDRVQELADEGIDEVTAWVSHRLAANVENLILDGASDIDGVGNYLSNRITGNAGDNVLDGGGGGHDVLAGGRGNDIYYIDPYFSDLTVTIVEQAGEGIDEIRVRSESAFIELRANIENVRLLGSGVADAYGNDLNNSMVGGIGKNLLKGEAGDDLLMGGAGDDNLTGGLGKDRLYGGSGNDVLNIGEFADPDSGKDVSVGEIYDGGDGVDTLYSFDRIDLSKTIFLNIENLEIEAEIFSTKLSISQIESFSNITATFIEISNGGSISFENTNLKTYGIILSDFGNSLLLDNKYSGLQIFFGSGDDVVIGSNAVDLNGLEGNDTISGGSGHNNISGDIGDDILRGGGGGDVLRGDGGADQLEGGAGGDSFVFYAGYSGVDTIMDFSSSQGDKLAFADREHGTFSYRGAASFTAGGNSEARFAGGQVFVDMDGNGTADITVKMTGITSASQLHTSDFAFY